LRRDIISSSPIGSLWRGADLALRYPKDPRAHLAHATGLLITQDLKGAEAELRSALSQTAQLDVLPRIIESTILAALANVLFLEGRAGEAKDLARRACPLLPAGNLLRSKLLEERLCWREMAAYDEAIRLKPNDAPAYDERGLAWTETGDLDRAIADFTQAIKINPDDGLAYRLRGRAFESKGDIDSSIFDLGQAIRINPGDSDALWNRGLVRFYAGRFAESASDLRPATELGPEPYRMLLLFLAGERVGRDGLGELQANAGRLKTKDWPYPVIEFYLKSRSLEGVNSAAVKPEERCEARFYVGEWHLLNASQDDAVAALRDAAAICPKTYIEYSAAVAELKRLKR
jgi:lipoprotein NlpI